MYSIANGAEIAKYCHFIFLNECERSMLKRSDNLLSLELWHFDSLSHSVVN